MTTPVIVNGINLEGDLSPSKCNVVVNVVSDAERNSNGDMLIQRVCEKRTIELEFGYLSQEKYSQLYQAVVEPTSFSVTYYDDATGKNRVGTFYGGNLKQTKKRALGKYYYTAVTINLIEV